MLIDVAADWLATSKLRPNPHAVTNFVTWPYTAPHAVASVVGELSLA